MKSLKVYLCGSMTNLPDGGVKWREREMKWGTPLGLRYYSPPKMEPKTAKKMKLNFKDLIFNSKKLDASVRIPLFRRIIKKDCVAVRKSDIVIAYLTKCSWGTAGELTWAFMNKIPVHIVNGTGAKLDCWPEACGVTVHKSFERLHNYLKYHYKLRKTK